MKYVMVAAVAVVLVLTTGMAARGHSLNSVFNKVNATVVEIDTHESVMREANGARGAVIRRQGSGVLIGRDGRIITASHLVESADQIVVKFLEGTESKAKVVASEPATDLALLVVERVPRSAQVAKLGNSDHVGVGDEIFVVGTPYGMSHALSVGHISARHEQRIVLGDLTLGEFFQTDAAVNKGNSGGPMFNMAGEVIGIVSHTLSRSGGFEGIGLAATSNMARRLLLERKAFWTGIDGYWLSGDMAKVFNLSQSCGILVQGVASGSPASRLGLRAGMLEARVGGEKIIMGGDVILEIQGVCLHGEESYNKARERMSGLNWGDTLRMKVLRGGKIIELSTTVERSIE